MTLDQAYDQGIAPWDKMNVVIILPGAVVYQDAFPVANGHLLFVPHDDTVSSITNAFNEACSFHKASESANIGINLGTAAGQTVMYPHIHYIPRVLGDVENPRGGIRNVIPGCGDYK